MSLIVKYPHLLTYVSKTNIFIGKHPISKIVSEQIQLAVREYYEMLKHRFAFSKSDHMINIHHTCTQ